MGSSCVIYQVLKATLLNMQSSLSGTIKLPDSHPLTHFFVPMALNAHFTQHLLLRHIYVTKDTFWMSITFVHYSYAYITIGTTS